MKIAPSLPLQDMIRGVLQQATEKLAADHSDKGSGEKKMPFGKPDKEKSDKSDKKDDKGDKEEFEKEGGYTDPTYVEKLASAVEYIAEHTDEIVPVQKGVLRQAIEKVSTVPVSQIVGESGLQVSKSIDGYQKYKKDKPITVDPAMSTADSPLSAGGMPGGKTQLDNNMHKAPGQKSGKTPTAKYPEKGPLVNMKKHGSIRDFYKDSVEKQASSLGNDIRRAVKSGAGVLGKAKGELPNVSNFRSLVKGAAKAPQGVASRFAQLLKGGRSSGNMVGNQVKNIRPGNSPMAILKNKGMRGEALKSLGARAAVAGTATAGTVGAVKGVKALSGKEQPEKTASDLAREQILSKLAGEDVMKANVSVPRKAGPMPGGGPLAVNDANSKGPRQPGGPTSGFGNEKRPLIGSNSAAINYTKRDAKKSNTVKQMGTLLDEPAFNPKSDTKLKENLRNTGKAGVKIAAARAQLQKLASEGCACNGRGICAYCTMEKMARARFGKSKIAEGGPTPPNAMMAGTGGGHSTLADASEAPDGCTCDHKGECRVCKLKAKLQSSKTEKSEKSED